MADVKKNEDWKVFLVIASFIFSIAFAFWAEGQNERAFEPKLTRITLAAAGCEYVQRQTWLIAKSIGKNGSCEMDADFTQYHRGSGGNIFYGHEDSQSLQISESQVVGIMSLPEVPNKSWTHEQTISVWRLSLAMIFLLSNFIFITIQLNKLNKKKRKK
jgi:hypothetical protein